MAQDETPGQPPNGSAGPGEGGSPVQFSINAQYLKDLSFENPRAPQSLVQQGAQPEVGFEAQVKVATVGPDVYEVLLTISADVKVKGQSVFIVQCTYGGVATIKNANQEMLTGLLYVEMPRLLFPFAHNIIASATRDGGFPPLLISPIDFKALLQREQAKARGETATA
jgi:preprotein translocase subunit SecB